MLIPGVQTSRHDVGGSSEMSTPNPSMGVHGSTAAEMPLIFDGMRYSNIYGVGGASSGPYIVNNGIIAEVAVTTSGGGADQEVSGVVANIIPKQGGNNFSAYFFQNFNNDSLQADNLDDELRSRGASTGSVIEKAFDTNVGIGGPIVQDRLWFYGSWRRYGIDDAPAGARFELDPFDTFFEADLTQSAINENRIRNSNLRLTWQPASAHRVTFYADDMHRFLSHNGLSAIQTAEASTFFDDPVDRILQTTWNWAVSNELLIEFGETYKPDTWQFVPIEGNNPSLPGIRDFGTGVRYRAPTFSIRQDSQQWNGKASVTYVTGSHNLKVGSSWFHGWRTANSNGLVNREHYLRFRDGVPFRITQFAPSSASLENLDMNLGLFVQEQYTLDQVTINAGIRLTT